MASSKQGTTKDGQPMHYSVGALICKDGQYLLIDRAIPPFGFAGAAGHIDEKETPEQALIREVEEEIGLKIDSEKLLFEEELNWNLCSEGINNHYWYLFECEATGEIKRSKSETKSVGWYSPDNIKELTLEPVWEYWFKKLKII